MGLGGDAGVPLVIAAGRTSQLRQMEPVPSQELKQSRGDSFQRPRGTRQGPRQAESAPLEPRPHVWHVGLSLRSAFTPRLPLTGGVVDARGPQAVLGRGVWTGLVAAWLRGRSRFCCRRCRGGCSPQVSAPSINTTGKSINFTALIDVLL